MRTLPRRLPAAVLVLCLSACSGTEVERGVVVDPIDCQPEIGDSSHLGAAQTGCHLTRPGRGTRIYRYDHDGGKPWIADDEWTERMSLYLPEGFRDGAAYLAFYSEYVPGMPGKTGCMGTLDRNRSRVHVERQRVEYDLVFDLASPLGWSDDCRQARRLAGTARL